MSSYPEPTHSALSVFNPTNYPTSSNNYATISDLAEYLPLTGGNLTGALTLTTTSVLRNALVMQTDSGDTSYEIGIRGSQGSPDNAFYVYRDTIEGNSVASYSMLIDSSGNVGLGTTTPSTKLHVYSGDVTLSDSYSVTWGKSGKIQLGYPCTQSSGSYASINGPFIRSKPCTSFTTSFTVFLSDLVPASTDNTTINLRLFIKSVSNLACAGYAEYVIVKAVGSTTYAGLNTIHSYTSGITSITPSASGDDLVFTISSVSSNLYYSWIATGSS